MFQDNGPHDIKNMKKYGKIVKVMEGSKEALVVADTEILKHVLVKDFTDFTNRRVCFYFNLNLLECNFVL